MEKRVNNLILVRVASKLDRWLQMNVMIHKLLSFQILGQIYHENQVMTYQFIFICPFTFLESSFACRASPPAQRSREWRRPWPRHLALAKSCLS